MKNHGFHSFSIESFDASGFDGIQERIISEYGNGFFGDAPFSCSVLEDHISLKDFPEMRNGSGCSEDGNGLGKTDYGLRVNAFSCTYCVNGEHTIVRSLGT